MGLVGRTRHNFYTPPNFLRPVFTKPGAHQFDSTVWPASSQDPIISGLWAFYMDAGDLNLCPQASSLTH